ncbi:hypothetical protein GCM10023340_05700 [Nocardioides marinquilinus]|uniref:Uncharacterized protein n=1 Tax=Nocardioides marinquilinus TaxID=1210400 RepID=A0ABP9P8E1_9ACTN
MSVLRTVTAGLGAAALLATPLALATATPASAAERQFRCAGSPVDFEVEKDDGRYEVDVDLDGRRGDQWRITLRQDGGVFYNQVRRVDADGDIDVDRTRPNTAGRDVFKLTVKKIGGPAACSSTIAFR